MESEGNYFDYFTSSKSNFNNDFITQINLALSKKMECNNFQQDSYYLLRNSPENDSENSSFIKEELECDTDKNIDNFLTKDIINSINDINSDLDNSVKNESIGDISIEDKKDTSQKYNENEESDYLNDEDLKIEKEIISKFPFDLNIDEPPDFLINNNSALNNNKNNLISHDNIQLNNNANINNENGKIKIFNNDNNNQKSQQNNNQNLKFNESNICLKSDVNYIEDRPIFNNKETTNLNELFCKNESYKLNSDNININNKEHLNNGKFFDNNFINQKILFKIKMVILL